MLLENWLKPPEQSYHSLEIHLKSLMNLQRNNQGADDTTATISYT